MSMTRVENAYLSDYEGPVFPENINELNKALDKLFQSDLRWPSMAWEVLKQIAKPIPGFQDYLGYVRTKDGYTWLSELSFWLESKEREREVVILLPLMNDNQMGNGVSLDRSIAAYHTGGVSAEEIETIVQSLISAMGKWMGIR